MSSSPSSSDREADELQGQLDSIAPSPEADIVGLCDVLAMSPDTQQYAAARRQAVEIDNLISQLRWDLAQALDIQRRYPSIHEVDPRLFGIGVVNSARLGIRGFRADPGRVVFADLNGRWREGGTVAGWIFHMAIDNAVSRALAIMDRLARLVAAVADVSFPNGKVYFRSGKLEAINRALDTSETRLLLELSTRSYFVFLTEYRDGLAHERMRFGLAGNPPGDMYTDTDGQRIVLQEEQWTARTLLALGLGGYLLVVEALGAVRRLCERMVPRSPDAPPTPSGPAA